MVVFFCELQVKTGSGQLSINNTAEPISVTFDKFNISLVCGTTQCSLALPYAMVIGQLNPQNIHGTTYIRLTLNPDSPCPTVVPNFQPLAEKFQRDLIQTLATCWALNCRTCSNPIIASKTRDKLFTRVLPLPSEGWYDLNESLSCHASHVAKERLAPGSGVCLVGADYYTIASADVLASSLSKEIGANNIEVN